MNTSPAWRRLQIGSRIEALVAAGFLLVAVTGESVSQGVVDWTLVVSGIFVIWSILLAPDHDVRTTGVLICLAFGLFIARSETAIFVTVAAFVVLQVQIRHGRWAAALATSVILAAWFVVGDPLHAWTVSGIGAALVAVLGMACAVAIGMTRRALESSRRELAASLELERMRTRIELARTLHDNVADSLTRIVLMSPQTEAIHGEARRAIDSLRMIMRRLRGEEDGTNLVNLAVVIDTGIADMRALGLEVVADVEGMRGLVVGEQTAAALREAFTNVLKHGDAPVRVVGECDEEKCRVFMVNAKRSAPRDQVGGTGLGLDGMRECLLTGGGSIQFVDTQDTARVVMEFPIRRGVNSNEADIDSDRR